MRARVPASSANLGSGFDALAIGLTLYVDVTVEPSEHFTIHTTGEGSTLPADQTHLAAQIAVEVAGTDRLAITVHSDIPVGRGLGSSAALAVAAAAAAGARDPLAIGARVDGHPENAAASTLGGLVAAASIDGVARAERLALDPHLSFVVLVPDQPLPTKQARAALPASVPHADAVFNLGRMGLLIAGLADHRLLAPQATDDRLHQRYRAALFPQAERLMAGMVGTGALASCWSGAGPSILGICSTGTASKVAERSEALLVAEGLAGRIYQLGADHQGVTVTPS